MIPSLIPLPPTALTAATPATDAANHDEKEDIFATLFSPSTPRASPDPNVSLTRSPILAHPQHGRNPSTDSDFGAFVSVPPTEDPLHQNTSLNQLDEGLPSISSQGAFSPLQNWGFFDRFVEGAKAATEKNKRDVLDELLENEDDPLHFLRAAPARDEGVLGASTPVPPISSVSSAQPSLIDLSPTAEFWSTKLPLVPEGSLTEEPGEKEETGDAGDEAEDEAEDSDSDGDEDEPAPDRRPPAESIPLPYFIKRVDEEEEEPPRNEHARTSRHPTRHTNRSEPAAPRLSPTSSFRSTSIPPPPSPSMSIPEIQPAQSSVFTSSSFSSGGFPTKWVSSLLSRPSAGGRRSSSQERDGNGPSHQRSHTTTESVVQEPRASSSGSPPLHGGLGTLTSVHSRIQSAISARPSIIGITHGTPFASEPYIPPSGAPGFAGDRAWNTGGFEFDKDKVEKKSVRLAGRKEFTSPVLTSEVADLLRPHFSALSRLPRSWTLLYSLDQHGISLNTLYTRCEATPHASALVVVRDANDGIFGAWIGGGGLKMGKGAYYGSGESFLWKLDPHEHGQEEHPSLSIYRWAAKNDYVALCEPDYISFGGGDGHYGLYLDSSLSEGSSSACPTFANEPLCSGPSAGGEVGFDCVGLEVWGVG